MSESEQKSYFKGLSDKLDKLMLHQEGMKKDIAQNVKDHKDIKDHMEKSDGRIEKLEVFKNKLIGMAILIIGGSGIATTVISIIKGG